MKLMMTEGQKWVEGPVCTFLKRKFLFQPLLSLQTGQELIWNCIWKFCVIKLIKSTKRHFFFAAGYIYVDEVKNKKQRNVIFVGE